MQLQFFSLLYYTLNNTKCREYCHAQQHFATMTITMIHWVKSLSYFKETGTFHDVTSPGIQYNSCYFIQSNISKPLLVIFHLSLTLTFLSLLYYFFLLILKEITKTQSHFSFALNQGLLIEDIRMLHDGCDK